MLLDLAQFVVAFQDDAIRITLQVIVSFLFQVDYCDGEAVD